MIKRFAPLLCILAIAAASASGTLTTLRFGDPPSGTLLSAGWKPYRMSRHRSMAQMHVVDNHGDEVLRIRADRNAGAIAHVLDLSPGRMLTWRWKVDHSVAAADLAHKSGDDSAARVYVFFDVPSSALSLGQRLKLRIARMVLGHAMPRAALCYVWDNRHPVGSIAPSPFYDGMRTIVLQSGNAHAGHWQVQRRNLAADFRAAFGRPAPRITGIALAADTDNTGSRATAWFGDVRLGAVGAPGLPAARSP